MMQHRRKLIEVALPLEAMYREPARKKPIRYGQPSTQDLRGAQRPLAAASTGPFISAGRRFIFADRVVPDPGSAEPRAQAASRAELKVMSAWSRFTRGAVG